VHAEGPHGIYENFIRYRLRKQARKIIHPRLSLDHLDFAAFFAISFRFLVDSLFALAGPPFLAMSVTYWFLGALFFPSHPKLDVVVACPELSRRDEVRLLRREPVVRRQHSAVDLNGGYHHFYVYTVPGIAKLPRCRPRSKSRPLIFQTAEEGFALSCGLRLACFEKLRNRCSIVARKSVP